jgi:hypothetical protein
VRSSTSYPNRIANVPARVGDGINHVIDTVCSFQVGVVGYTATSLSISSLCSSPALETKEYLGGFWVIEAADLDVALALAVEGSKAYRGTVEVRPFRTEESVRALLEP